MSAQPNNELDKILPNFDTWCLCGADECTKYQNYKNDKEYLLNKFTEDRTHTLQAQQYTRLEVIDHTDQGTGREYSKWGATPFTVKFDEQDDGRTLKIFLEDGVPSNE